MRAIPRTVAISWLLGALAVAGCGDDDGGGRACVAGETRGCAAGLVCENVADGTTTCAAPIEIRGRVLDATDGAGIADAHVVALDANGAARTTVTATAADGTYSLPIAMTRAADGTVVAEAITLRVDASGYQTFPTAPRTAIPVDVSEASLADDAGARVVMNAATDVALLRLAGGGADGVVEGYVLADDPGGVLVVADQGGRAVSTAVTDLDGAYTLFNVPAAETTVAGYREGLRATPETLTTNGEHDLVDLDAFDDGLATVSGNVNIVNAPGGSTTSVILVVESTFVESAARGEAPAGLRAAPVSGAFEIQGVPPGRYVALAAFENDALVRDPDTSIGGTSIVHVEVAGTDVALSESFKVTEALGVVSPGAERTEAVTGDPTFRWADDSSEDGYEVRVFDAFGTMVHENTSVPRVTGSGEVTYTWTGAALEPGMIYQFRALSFHDERGAHVYISATEDLRGTFTRAP